MATKEQAKFLYFSASAKYEEAKSSMIDGAIAFDAQGQHIYVKADSTHVKEYYIGEIVNNLITNDTTKSLSAAQGKILKELIDGIIDTSIGGLDTRLTTVETKVENLESSVGDLDASVKDYAIRIGAIEVLDTKMQEAIIAVAKACAANELEAADKSVTVTPGEVNPTVVDGSIMSGVQKATVKVNLSGNTIGLDGTGLFVQTANLTGIPQAAVSGLETRLNGVDSSIDTLQALVGDTSVGEQIEAAIAIEASARADADTAEASARADADASLEARKVDKETGKSLIADSEITRLLGIETGAQVNKIETVKVNGTALTITDKAVDVVIPAASVTGVKSGDKVLALDGTELTSTLNLSYDTTAKEIRLWGISNTTPIASIDATDFIKDGMIDSVELDQHDGKTWLKITFNTEAGKSPIELDVTQLIDIYTVDPSSANYLAIDGSNRISAKVEVANGLASYAHLTKTDSSVADLSTNFHNYESSTNGKFVQVDNKDIAQDSSISAINTVVEKLDGDVTVAGSVKKQIYDASTATESKLKGTYATDASTAETIAGAKKYADAVAAAAAEDVAISGTVQGDGTYISSSISASGKTISGQVSATTALINAVNNANSAIQGVKVNGTALTKDSSMVNVTVAIGSDNGTIAVNSVDVAVKGLQSAAYVTTASLDASMDTKDNAVKSYVIGTDDSSASITVRGARAYAEALTAWYVE